MFQTALLEHFIAVNRVHDVGKFINNVCVNFQTTAYFDYTALEVGFFALVHLDKDYLIDTKRWMTKTVHRR